MHKHCFKGTANLVSITALAYIEVHFSSQITQLSLSSNTFVQIQAQPLDMFITEAWYQRLRPT